MKLTNALTVGLLALLATTAFVGPAAADTAGAAADSDSGITVAEYEDDLGQHAQSSVSADAASSDEIVGAGDNNTTSSDSPADSRDAPAGDEIVADHDGGIEIGSVTP